MRVANERVAAGIGVKTSVRLQVTPLAKHPRHHHYDALSSALRRGSHPIRLPVFAKLHWSQTHDIFKDYTIAIRFIAIAAIPEIDRLSKRTERGTIA